MYLYFQTHIITSFEAHSFQRAAMLSSDTRFYCLITIVALPPPALFSLVGISYSYGPLHQTLFYSRPLKNHGHKCFITERKQIEMGHNIEPLYCQQTTRC